MRSCMYACVCPLGGGRHGGRAAGVVNVGQGLQGPSEDRALQVLDGWLFGSAHRIPATCVRRIMTGGLPDVLFCHR